MVASDPLAVVHKNTVDVRQRHGARDHRGTMAVASSSCFGVEEAREIDRYFADINAYIARCACPHTRWRSTGHSPTRAVCSRSVTACRRHLRRDRRRGHLPRIC